MTGSAEPDARNRRRQVDGARPSPRRSHGLRVREEPRLLGGSRMVLLEAPHREAVPAPVGDAGGRGPRGRDGREARDPWAEAARRMWAPSARGPRPRGVFTTSWTFPPAISSTASRACPCRARRPWRPWSRPRRRGARGSPPSPPSPPTRNRAPRTRAPRPPPPACRGRRGRRRRPRRREGGCPAAIWLLAKARPNVRSMPITSPVERISGPSSESTSGKRSNGRTASFTLTWPGAGRRRRASRPSARSSASVAPSMARAAILASGTPVALATNGTVRLARGFASMTKTCRCFTAYWTLSGPQHSERGGDAARVVLDEGHGRRRRASAAGSRTPSRPSARRPPRRAP